MDQFLVRICDIKLKGFKNTNSGVVQMPAALNNAYFSSKADILGIYGQNGSGKTAVIEAMDFIQRLLTGRSLPDDTAEYIGMEQNRCGIQITFALEMDGVQSKITYGVLMTRAEDNSHGADNDFYISEESLVSSRYNGTKFETKKTLLCFNSTVRNGRFSPEFRYKALVRANEENRVNLHVAHKLAYKEHCSVIFGKEGRQIFLSAPAEISSDYQNIIAALHRYACFNLFVIPNAHSGVISLNLTLPFAFRLSTGRTITKGDLPIPLDQPSVITKERYGMVKQILAEMNSVLSKMIPGLSIDLYDFGEQLLESGASGHKIELISRRGDVRIPLKYESEGIIKMISILNVLLCIFNDPSMCLVIDELDSGIFEYLLGELLSVLEKGARGQLLFTSHNLRALEMLNKASIVFSTTNPENRYMRLQHVKTNHNLRDLYLRSISLGGQKEEVYAETDTVEIGRAFRRAGKAVWDAGKK